MSILFLWGLNSCLSGPAQVEPEPTATPLARTPEPTPQPTLQPTPESVTPEPATPEPEVLEISEEVYNKTFHEIDYVINELNRIIADRDYTAWLMLLSKEYIEEKSSEAYLEEMSEMPTLKNKGKRLNSIKDYFLYVVVPSRAKASLEKIIFLDSDHIKAYGTIFNQSGILYYFEKIDNQWKIGIW